MKSGRELDRLIAEKVMGFHKIHTHGNRLIGLGPVPPGTASCLNTTEIPAYSTDIAAAWQVVDAVQYKHAGGLISLFRNGTDTYWCSFDHEEKPGVTGDTAPHAICLAALKAINE